MKKLFYYFSFVFAFFAILACTEQDEIIPLETIESKTAIEKGDNFLESLTSDDGCETAFAYCDNHSKCFLDLDFSRWGWTNGPYSPDDGWVDIYAGAGQCETDKGVMVGKLYINYSGSTATVTYEMDAGYTLNEVHFYIGNDILPTMKNGKYTVAPGQYNYKDENINGEKKYTFTVDDLPGGDIYFIGHAVVCGINK